MNFNLSQLRSLVKNFDNFYVHAERRVDVESYSDEAIFRVTGSKKIDGKEVKQVVIIPGVIRNGSTSERADFLYEGRTVPNYSQTAYRPDGGYFSLSEDLFCSAILTMPNDAECVFNVNLDGGTTQNHIAASMHSDNIYLEGTRPDTVKGVRHSFRYLMGSYCGLHNTARFGTPIHDRDTRGRSF